jgi:hypothetical protein
MKFELFPRVKLRTQVQNSRAFMISILLPCFGKLLVYFWPLLPFRAGKIGLLTSLFEQVEVLLVDGGLE